MNDWVKNEEQKKAFLAELSCLTRKHGVVIAQAIIGRLSDDELSHEWRYTDDYGFVFWDKVEE